MVILKEEVLEYIGLLSVLEFFELVKMFEKKFGVSVILMVVVGVVVVGGVVVESEEKIEFNVILVDSGVEKIKVIKVVCEIIGFGLKEVKDVIEKILYVFKEGVNKEEVEIIKKKFEEVGVKVEVK